MFFRLFKYLLPRGCEAWNLTIDRPLRQFFDALKVIGEDVKEYIDLIWFDIFPQTTRELSMWENQFGLIDSGLTEQERRDRLEATWAQTGGQSIKYIQDQLQANGFDVYLHEWFDPTSIPAVNVKVCVTPRNPNLLTNLKLLANKITVTRPAYIAAAGEDLMECGEATAICGNFIDLIIEDVEYDIPTDPDKWAYIFYVGGATYGDSANVPASRQNEFETLLMKLKPASNWAGLLINYV